MCTHLVISQVLNLVRPGAQLGLTGTGDQLGVAQVVNLAWYRCTHLVIFQVLNLVLVFGTYDQLVLAQYFSGLVLD
jgi:hypothetical protein